MFNTATVPKRVTALAMSAVLTIFLVPLVPYTANADELTAANVAVQNNATTVTEGDYTLSLSKANFIYDGRAKEPDFELTIPSYSQPITKERIKTLHLYTYTYRYENNVNAGTGTLIISNNGTDIIKTDFTIEPVNLNALGEDGLWVPECEYAGVPATPKFGFGAELGMTNSIFKEDIDSGLCSGVSYAFSNNNGAGTGTLTVTSTGPNFIGSATTQFTIDKGKDVSHLVRFESSVLTEYNGWAVDDDVPIFGNAYDKYWKAFHKREPKFSSASVLRKKGGTAQAPRVLEKPAGVTVKYVFDIHDWYPNSNAGKLTSVNPNTGAVKFKKSPLWYGSRTLAKYKKNLKSSKYNAKTDVGIKTYKKWQTLKFNGKKYRFKKVKTHGLTDTYYVKKGKKTVKLPIKKNGLDSEDLSTFKPFCRVYAVITGNPADYETSSKTVMIM